jgi:hypothetical protein
VLPLLICEGIKYAADVSMSFDFEGLMIGSERQVQKVWGYSKAVFPDMEGIPSAC